MDYDKLIERLRNAAGGPEGIQMCQDAATAIEALQAESIIHHNAADNYWHELNEYREERNEALADLARVTAERDAAIECLKNKCPFCRKYLTCQGRTINNDCWEFFGLKED